METDSQMHKHPSRVDPERVLMYLIHPIYQYERFRNRALSGLSEGPNSLIKRPNFKIIYNFLIKNKG